MKIIDRSFVFTMTALAAVFFVNVVAAQSPDGGRQKFAFASDPAVPSGVAVIGQGPRSPLYLTAGDNNMIWVVQGNSVINSWSAHNTEEYAIAILSTVRTLGESSPGSDYTLGGTYTGTDYPYPATGAAFYDGTTDGVLNYSVDFSNGGVYSMNSDWTNLISLFSTPAGDLGIAFDRSSGTFWLATFNGSTVEHRSHTGAVLSSFTVPFTSITCLALDPADGTLWMGSQDTQGTFYQYSQTGALLNTVHYIALETQNTLGGEFPLTAVQKYEVNADATIAGPNGGNAFCDIFDVENEQVTKKYLEGVISYQDRASHVSFSTGKITTASVYANGATFSGTARIGGKHKQMVNFTIAVTGNQSPATNDTFSISLSNGYQASGNLTSGFIDIQAGD
jgi:hypothetical protein